MKLSLCNEVLQPMPIEAQFDFAGSVGYEALELAPFTLNSDPTKIAFKEIDQINKYQNSSGICVSGLHWLLVSPGNLSITTKDSAIRQQTVSFMKQLIQLCADLGGSYLVHGSPLQRRLPETLEHDEIDSARERGIESWNMVSETAENAGITYCIEALAPPQSNFVNTVEEAVEILKKINSPNVRTMIDCCAVRKHEAVSVAELISKWLPLGYISHVHVNDRNRRGPGQGNDEFASVVTALVDNNYAGWIGVEPFDYIPDGPTTAAFCAGFMHSLISENIQFR